MHWTCVVASVAPSLAHGKTSARHGDLLCFCPLFGEGGFAAATATGLNPCSDIVGVFMAGTNTSPLCALASMEQLLSLGRLYKQPLWGRDCFAVI